MGSVALGSQIIAPYTAKSADTFEGYTIIDGVLFKGKAEDITNKFSEVTEIETYGLQQAFAGWTRLTGSANFPKLTTIGIYGLELAFDRCIGITSANFPKLITIDNGGLANAFYGCTNLTEIHFRADAQTVVEGLRGYSSKFGATNATIYFDL